MRLKPDCELRVQQSEAEPITLQSVFDGSSLRRAPSISTLNVLRLLANHGPHRSEAADRLGLGETLARDLVAPDPVRVDSTILLGRLVGAKLVHPVGDDLRVIDHDVGLLRVHERLSVAVAEKKARLAGERRSPVRGRGDEQVAVADDGALAVDRHELDVAVARLVYSVERLHLILACESGEER
jgi:hypothetical protein